MRIAVVAALAALIATPAYAEPPGLGIAHLILYNGTIITMDKGVPQAEAVAIVDDRFVAVGSNADAMRWRGVATTVIDLKGLPVVPGFIDSHSHILFDHEHVPPFKPVPVEDAAEAALAVGWTGLTEMFGTQERVDELRAVDSEGRLRLRVNAFLPVNYHDEHYGVWFGGHTPGEYVSEHVRLAGAKIYVDPADPHTMLLTQPHLGKGDGDSLGHASWTQDELTAMVADLHDRGWQIAAHSVGDGAQDMILNAYDNVVYTSNDRRHRIEHALVIRDDQLGRMDALGIYASFQLNWCTSDWASSDEEIYRWWRELPAELGPDRLGWACRWRDLIDNGVPTVGSTDAPWSPATPMQAIHQAVTRVGFAGAPPQSWMLDQRITVDQALRLLTIDAAWGTHEEHLRGSITQGKLADLVVLSGNPLMARVEDIPRIDAMMTMVGGQIQHCPWVCPGPPRL